MVANYYCKLRLMNVLYLCTSRPYSRNLLSDAEICPAAARPNEQACQGTTQLVVLQRPPGIVSNIAH